MSKQKIMIVDDEPLIIELLKSILEAENFKVIIANNGQEAIDKITRIKPDLTILDIMMPIMSGFDVCEEIRSNPKTEKLKVVFLSALKLSAIDKSYLKKLKAIDYLSKPFDNKELISKINHYLEI